MNTPISRITDNYAVSINGTHTPEDLYALTLEIQKQLKEENPTRFFPEDRLPEDACIGHTVFRRGVKVGSLVRGAINFQKLRDSQPPLPNSIAPIFTQSVVKLANYLQYSPPEELRDAKFYEGFISRFTESFIQAIETDDTETKLANLRDVWAITYAIFCKSLGKDLDAAFWLTNLIKSSSLEPDAPTLPTPGEMDGGEPFSEVIPETLWRLNPYFGPADETTLTSAQVQDFIERANTMGLLISSFEMNTPQSFLDIVNHLTQQTRAAPKA